MPRSTIGGCWIGGGGPLSEVCDHRKRSKSPSNERFRDRSFGRRMYCYCGGSLGQFLRGPVVIIVEVIPRKSRADHTPSPNRRLQSSVSAISFRAPTLVLIVSKPKEVIFYPLEASATLALATTSPSSRSTVAVSPALRLPERSSSDSLSSMTFWIRRRRGRAPKLGS